MMPVSPTTVNKTLFNKTVNTLMVLSITGPNVSFYSPPSKSGFNGEPMLISRLSFEQKWKLTQEWLLAQSISLSEDVTKKLMDEQVSVFELILLPEEELKTIITKAGPRAYIREAIGQLTATITASPINDVPQLRSSAIFAALKFIHVITPFSGAPMINTSKIHGVDQQKQQQSTQQQSVGPEPTMIVIRPQSCAGMSTSSNDSCNTPGAGSASNTVSPNLTKNNPHAISEFDHSTQMIMDVLQTPTHASMVSSNNGLLATAAPQPAPTIISVTGSQMDKSSVVTGGSDFKSGKTSMGKMSTNESQFTPIVAHTISQLMNGMIPTPLAVTPTVIPSAVVGNTATPPQLQSNASGAQSGSSTNSNTPVSENEDTGEDEEEENGGDELSTPNPASSTADGTDSKVPPTKAADSKRGPNTDDADDDADESDLYNECFCGTALADTRLNQVCSKDCAMRGMYSQFFLLFP
jgi:hypothetical protein